MNLRSLQSRSEVRQAFVSQAAGALGPACSLFDVFTANDNINKLVDVPGLEFVVHLAVG